MNNWSRSTTALVLAISLHAAAARAQATAPAPLEPPDPLLTPVEPAARRIARWSDISTNLRARSVDLAAAVADVRRAEAESRAALAPLYGQIQVQGQATQNLITKDTQQVTGVSPTGTPLTETVTSPIVRTANAGATASLPLIAPRQWQQVKTAHIGIDLAEELLGDQRRVLVERAASAVVAVVAAERVAEINRVGLKAAGERAALARRGKALGGGNSLDVVRAEQDLETARAQVVTGDESLRQAREALGLALGWSEQVGVEPGFRLDDAVVEAGRQCKAVPELDARADLVAAQTRVRLADQVRREATWGFAPTLSLQSQLAYTTVESPVEHPTQWTVQGVLSWDLWDGGARYAQIRSGVAQRDRAEAALAGARRDVAIAVKRADRGVQVAAVSREIAKRSRDSAFEGDRLTRLAFTTGNGTSLELVTAAGLLRSQEIQLAIRDYELVRARLLALLVRARCDL
jgi:outer membrane protein TolC